MRESRAESVVAQRKNCSSLRTHMANLRRASTFLSLIGVIVLSGGAAYAQPTVFRIQDMDLRDPHVFTSVITCLDLTDSPPFSINGNLQAAIQGDTDPADGFLDLSYVFEFSPLDQSLETNALEFGTTQCTAPMAGTTCSLAASATSATATLSDSQTCLGPLPVSGKCCFPSSRASLGRAAARRHAARAAASRNVEATFERTVENDVILLDFVGADVGQRGR